MPRTIEIEEQEVRKWTCPKCGGHCDSYPSKEVIHCGFGIHDDVDKSGCGAEFPHSEYESQSVVTGTQPDLLGAVYALLLEEAKLHGSECIVFGALPGDTYTWANGSVEDLDGVPFYIVNSGKIDRKERCKDCKFWRKVSEWNGHIELGECTQIVQNDWQHPNKGSSEALLQRDGEGTVLRTAGTFGCLLWKHTSA